MNDYDRDADWALRVAELGDLPHVIVDIWYSDYCREEDDVFGQWSADGGR